MLEGESLSRAVYRGTVIGALAVMSNGDNEGLPTKEILEKFIIQDKRSKDEIYLTRKEEV